MDQLYKEIIRFQQRCNDRMDDPRSGEGRALTQAVQRLEDEAQVRKNPRSIEDQVKRVIQALEHAGKAEAMSHNHVHEFIEECEQFRSKLRRM